MTWWNKTRKPDAELEEFRSIMTVPQHFEDGFSLSSLLGTLFLALVMVPGALYMELVAGMGIGGAAQWVTVLLFVEVAKRANAQLSRPQLFILFYMSGMIVGQSVYGTPLFTQFLVRSDAAVSYGISSLIPNWVAPAKHRRAAAHVPPEGVASRRGPDVVPAPCSASSPPWCWDTGCSG